MLHDLHQIWEDEGLGVWVLTGKLGWHVAEKY